MKSLIYTTCAILIAGLAAQAATYSDPLGDTLTPSGHYMDIVSVEVTNDADFLYFDLDVGDNAGFATDPYARFMIGFDTAVGGNSAANAWSDQITIPGMDFFGGGYTDSGSGAAINYYSSTLGGWPEWLNGGDGSTWIYYWGATVDANGIRFGVALSALGLSVGDTFLFDIYTGWSGDGRAIDAAGLNNGSSTQSSWATLQAYDSGNNVLSYTVSENTEPPPPPPPPPPANPAAVPTQPDLSQGWISTRYNQIISELDSNVNRAKAKILFIGDSITQFWNAEGSAVWTANGFGDPDGAKYALNLGEAGDRTEHVLHRIQPAVEGGAGNLDYADLAPATIVLLIGINNTWFHTNEQIIGGIEAVVESLAQREPQATIVLVSILPHVETARNQDKIIPINTAIRAYVDSGACPDHVAFLDAYPFFVDESGAQISSYYKDGVHLTQAGYELYSSLLLPVLDSSLVNYGSWASDYGLVGGPDDDDDGDGFSNLYEYALGGIPTSPADIPDAPGIGVVSDGGSKWIEYTHAKRSALGDRAYYNLQVNPDLVPGLWVNANATVTGIQPINADFDRITSRIPIDQDRQFVRLFIQESAPLE